MRESGLKKTMFNITVEYALVRFEPLEFPILYFRLIYMFKPNAAAYRNDMALHFVS